MVSKGGSILASIPADNLGFGIRKCVPWSAALAIHAMYIRSFLCAALVSAATFPLRAEEAPVVKAGATFAAMDSLNCGEDASADASECLKGLGWTCGPFSVACEAAVDGQGDWLMRFPSPKPVGKV